MSWNTDKFPIDYLRQRIKYYKKKKSIVLKMINKPNLIIGYGEDVSKQIIARRLLTIESLLIQFQKAVRDLEAIENTENYDETK
jgi:hypothetical protein